MAEDRDNWLRGRLNALGLSLIDAGMHRIYGDRKRRMFGELPASVVEIGAGVGANFRYYPQDTMVAAVEPNRRMHRRLKENADRHGIDLSVLSDGGETVSLPSDSVDLVVCTLVLCSVEDPAQVVSEALRVLKPGGRYVFLEHVAAAEGSGLATWQRVLHRPWKWCTEGCHLNRDTSKVLEEAGFARLELDRFEVHAPVSPVAPHVAGVGWK